MQVLKRLRDSTLKKWVKVSDEYKRAYSARRQFLIDSKAGTPLPEVCEFELCGKKAMIYLYDPILGNVDFPNAMVTVSQTKYDCDIICNKAALDLEMDIFKAMIAHEIGHVFHNHTFKPFRRMFGMKSEIQKELAADRFAVDNGHRNGMIKLLKLFPRSKEVSLRMQNLL